MQARGNEKVKNSNKQFGPKLQEVAVYFDQKGLSIQEAEQFYAYYALRNWRNQRCNPIVNWKLAAAGWIRNLHKLYPHLFRPDTAHYNNRHIVKQSSDSINGSIIFMILLS